MIGARRRPILVAAAVLGIAVLVLLAVALAGTQRDARRTVESRFADGSKAAASLVQTIVGQAYASDAAGATATLAGRTVDQPALRAAAKALNAPALVVLDARGRRLGSLPAAAAATPVDGPQVREALAGRPAISGVLSAGSRRIIEVAVPFESRAGRRVVVIPTPAVQVQKVLGPYLANLPGLTGHRAYIVGPRDEVMADSAPRRARDAALATSLRTAPRTSNVSYAGGRRQLATTAIAGTSWDLVDTADSKVLYSPVDGWQRALPWVVLVLLLAGGAFLLWLVDQFGRAAERARQASEAKSAFMASMSHELRTPMTTVIGFSEMLHDGRLGPLTDRQHEIVGHVVTSSRHLNQLISEILDLSRVEEGRMAFHPQEVHPHVLVGEVVDGMGGMAGDRAITLAVDAPDVGTAVLDPARFKQVLYNLISNAIKFTESGGTVAVRLGRQDDGDLTVAVVDDGPGIHPADVDKIFLPFEQGRHRNGGAGLGLAVSRRIVDAQGGAITVASTPGEGATFTVRLPARAA